MFVSNVRIAESILRPLPEPSVTVQFFPLSSPEEVVKNVARLEGNLDLYCWYEGIRGMPKRGADFMKPLLADLYRVKAPQIKIWLYSLKAWGLQKKVSQMSPSTDLGRAINRANLAAIKCIDSSDFFRFCSQVEKRTELYNFITRKLPEKKWLFKLSETQGKSKMRVGELFEDKTSLFDCIMEQDTSAAYAAMQYVEGYYLIQESVKRGIDAGQTQIDVAFVLPNKEGDYYRDLPQDLEEMLQKEFGSKLSRLTIRVSFLFFEYGEISSRPYIQKAPAEYLKPKEVKAYFDFFEPAPVAPSRRPFLRDEVHNINGWKE